MKKSVALLIFFLSSISIASAMDENPEKSSVNITPRSPESQETTSNEDRVMAPISRDTLIETASSHYYDYYTLGNPDQHARLFASYLGLPFEQVDECLKVTYEKIGLPRHWKVEHDTAVLLEVLETRPLSEIIETVHCMRPCFREDFLGTTKQEDHHQTTENLFRLRADEIRRRVAASTGDDPHPMHQLESYHLLSKSTHEIVAYKQSLASAITPENPDGFLIGLTSLREMPKKTLRGYDHRDANDFNEVKNHLVNLAGERLPDGSPFLSALGPHIRTFFNEPRLSVDNIPLVPMSTQGKRYVLKLMLRYCTKGHADLPLLEKQLKTVVADNMDEYSFIDFVRFLPGEDTDKMGRYGY